jgi:hypothetical protein
MGPIPIPSAATHAKLQIGLAQARERNHKIGQALLGGGKHIYFQHHYILPTQVA